MARVIGIDPGSGSWDVLGLDDDDVFLDVSVPTKQVLADPGKLLRIIEGNQPLDAIVAPSGHGIPLKPIAEMTDADIAKANLRRSSDPTVMGIGRVLHMLRDAGIKGYAIPGVKQLESVKPSFKYNRIDMGTADKVCAAAAAIVDQAGFLHVPLESTSFILVEVGFGFNAYIAVEGGKIVDGIGGSLGGMGFGTAGRLDGEVAYLLRHVSKKVIYGGGLSTIAGHPELSPKELFLMAKKDGRIADAVAGFYHDMLQGIYSLFPSFSSVAAIKEIVVSGRASEDIAERLSSPGILPPPFSIPVRTVRSIARISKIAAQGAAFIANGLAGGKHEALVKVMALERSGVDLLSEIHVGDVSLDRGDEV
ncbi:MAG: DUF1464 family protein [Candidatus Lokiarchaeota archaeon]|nr:DUF1464 family protein [Candidatus Lokiarchaeota archaeon]